MSLFTDEKFINSISYQLRNFKKKTDHLWNFSCPVCGDSKKNKLKARAYFHRYKDSIRLKCHNCSCNMSFADFLKDFDSLVYKEYVYESYLERGGDAKDKEAPDQKATKTVYKPKKKVYVPPKPTALESCVSIAGLPKEHPARAYLESRRIPEKNFTDLYWTEDFPAVVDLVCPGHHFALRKESRIIIPFLDTHRNLLAIQGRSLSNDGIRYITIKTHEDAPRIYGMHRLAKTWQRIYVVEGPFDSLFLPNCLAMAGSDIPEGIPKNKMIVVFDNEPNHPDTIVKIGKAIDQGYTVCIWPETHKLRSLKGLKDINQMILEGFKETTIREIIDMNAYTGVMAKLKLQSWSNPKGNRKDVNTQTTNERYNN